MEMQTSFKQYAVVLLVLSILPCSSSSSDSSPTSNLSADPNGYIVYCPCMGRFGNQADQFLGSLAFAKGLNRTLILPPWVEYRRTFREAVMEPFDTYFKVSPMERYHRVITMEAFMKELAPSVWPPGNRKVFCYSARRGKSKHDKCNAKEGNPFGPFWNWFNIDFDEAVVFEPLYYETSSPREMREWNTKYPSTDYPVLAFVGPPSVFPVLAKHARLHQYLEWSEDYSRQADQFIESNIPHRPFIAIHLRNGPDFEKACEHVSSTTTLFASQQCTGERGEYGATTHEMCFPSTSTVTAQVKREVLRTGAKTIFVATDFNDLKEELYSALENVAVVRQEEPASPLLDLAILGRADHFIGNCVSTFTAFAKRERDVKKLPSSFWAFERKKLKKEEL